MFHLDRAAQLNHETLKRNVVMTVALDPTKQPYKQPKRPAEPSEEQSKKVPKLREISPEELAHILEEHKKWVESKSIEGEMAYLIGANLQKANLKEANLQNANLNDANLQNQVLHKTNLQKATLGGANLQKAHLLKVNLSEANLSGANLQEATLVFSNLQKASMHGTNLQKAYLEMAELQEADLRFANLQQANLSRANLQETNMGGADLRGAAFNHTNLREANLQDANLTGAIGLLANQFAGANVSGAKLPPDIAEFAGLDQVEKISQRAQKLFLSILLGCVYCWLTIATTTDVGLLTNSGSSPLPIIQTKIPIAGFYWAAPLILLSLYFWFHLYLQRMWEELAILPAVFPDGKTLDKKVYPWLVNGLIRTHVRLLKEHTPALAGLQTRISIFLAWWVVPLTFLLFWLRYLPKHHWVGTIEHILLIVVACVFAGWSQALAKNTLRGQQRPTLDFATNWKIKEFWAKLDQRSWKLAFLGLGVILFTVVISDGAINGVSPMKAEENKRLAEQEQTAKGEKNVGQGKAESLAAQEAEGNPKQEQPVEEDKKAGPGLLGQVRTWYQARIPEILEFFQVRAFANFTEQAVSTRPANWFLMREPDAEDIADIVKGAQLRGEDLRGVNAQEAFLIKADLRGANLQEANLREANLKEANLRNANMKNANLQEANLQEANLFNANLQRASLLDANLQEADLYKANLQEAYGLTLSQIRVTRNWVLATYGDTLRAELHLPSDHNARMKKKDLGGYNLAGYNLRNAYLKVNLKGANLKNTQLQGANLERSKDLTQAQLNQACMDEHTRLPKGFTRPAPCSEEKSIPK